MLDDVTFSSRSSRDDVSTEGDEMLSLGEFLSESCSTRTSSLGSTSETSSVDSHKRKKKARLRDKSCRLQTIKSPSVASEESFTLLEILSDPDLTRPIERDLCGSEQSIPEECTLMEFLMEMPSQSLSRLSSLLRRLRLSSVLPLFLH